MSESATADADTDALVERLRAAADEYETARQRVADAGEQRLQRLAEYYEELAGLMDRYEERSTSDGEADVDMEAFIEYQEKLAHFNEVLPEDIDHYDAFEAVDDIMHQKWLKESDFAEAREALEPVADLVARLDERERAREEFEAARDEVEYRIRDIEERIDELERLTELGDADLDAPVERLREPIERYNDAVREAFGEFEHDASAREVLDFVVSTDPFPLVGYRQPPEDLRSYVENYPAGTETIPQLLEYADYSRSKLDHYVESADALKRNVATHRTYFQRLDGGPLTVDWPPPEAATLRWRCKELVPAVDRLDADTALTALREVRALTRREEYDRLRNSAAARTQLTDAERERLQSGAVAADLEQARQKRARLQDALDEYA
jgi:hypothetical protein